MAQAAAYELAASHASGMLRQSLVDLYRALEAEIAALTPLAGALGVTLPTTPAPGDPERPWGAILGEAFQAERTLQRLARELASVAGDPAMVALSTRLTSEIARDREGVRRLYLRYT
jgi:hypothetical protein